MNKHQQLQDSTIAAVLERAEKAEVENSTLQDKLKLAQQWRTGYEQAEAENAALQGELAKAKNESDAMDEFFGAAARHEKQASTIINAMHDDVHITVPLRDYTTMSPKDCYELGMMDGVAALKAQINAAIDAAMTEWK